MKEFRCRLVLETTQEAEDEAEARRIAVSEFAHYLLDERVEDEQVVVLLENCGSPCSERSETCKGTEAGDCDCHDCWECRGHSHLVDLENLGRFGEPAVLSTNHLPQTVSHAETNQEFLA